MSRKLYYCSSNRAELLGRVSFASSTPSQLAFYLFHLENNHNFIFNPCLLFTSICNWAGWKTMRLGTVINRYQYHLLLLLYNPINKCVMWFLCFAHNMRCMFNHTAIVVIIPLCSLLSGRILLSASNVSQEPVIGVAEHLFIHHCKVEWANKAFGLSGHDGSILLKNAD